MKTAATWILAILLVLLIGKTGAHPAPAVAGAPVGKDPPDRPTFKMAIWALVFVGGSVAVGLTSGEGAAVMTAVAAGLAGFWAILEVIRDEIAGDQHPDAPGTPLRPWWSEYWKALSLRAKLQTRLYTLLTAAFGASALLLPRRGDLAKRYAADEILGIPAAATVLVAVVLLIPCAATLVSAVDLKTTKIETDELARVSKWRRPRRAACVGLLPIAVVALILTDILG